MECQPVTKECTTVEHLHEQAGQWYLEDVFECKLREQNGSFRNWKFQSFKYKIMPTNSKHDQEMNNTGITFGGLMHVVQKISQGFV